MKFLPSFNLLDDAFTSMFDDTFFKQDTSMMKTDVSEKEGNYLLDMELPGYQKEDIKMSLDDGYLNISASRNSDNEEKDDKGNVIRKERYSGSCSRSFYVGDHIKENEINAKFENGELKIVIPKHEEKEIENKKYIEIQ